MENLNSPFRRILCLLLPITLTMMAAVSHGQVNLTGTSFNEHFVTKETMNRVMVYAGPGVSAVVVEAILTDVSNETDLIRTISNPISVKPGLNSINPGIGFFNKVQHGGGLVSTFINKQKRLPAGRFEQCVRVYVHTGEYDEDEDCRNVEVITNEFLRLISPFDGDTISERNPMLVWTTSAFDEMKMENKIYRLILAPMEDQTDPERVLSTIPAQFVREPLREFTVMYPSSVPQLAPLHSYAWRVEVVQDGIVVNRSESWKFTIAGDKKKEPMKYATLRFELGGVPYDAVDDKLYFSFSDPYAAGDSIPAYEIKKVSSEGELGRLTRDTIPRIEQHINESHGDLEHGSEPGEISQIRKNSGMNRYELDLSELNLEIGIYLLEVWNGKGEKERMKFRIL